MTVRRSDRLDLLDEALQVRSGSWASTQVVFREIDEKHRPAVPTGGLCGEIDHFAIQIFNDL
jgi:hypothetical protein